MARPVIGRHVVANEPLINGRICHECGKLVFTPYIKVVDLEGFETAFCLGCAPSQDTEGIAAIEEGNPSADK